MKIAPLLLLCVTAPAFAQANLIPNGDFELPVVPWAITSDVGTHGSTLQPTGSMSNATGSALRLFAPNANEVTAQLLVSVSPGSYHFGVTLIPAASVFVSSTLDYEVSYLAGTVIEQGQLFSDGQSGYGPAQLRAVRAIEVHAHSLLRVQLKATGFDFTTQGTVAVVDDVTLRPAEAGTILMNADYFVNELWYVHVWTEHTPTIPTFLIAGSQAIQFPFAGVPGALRLVPVVAWPLSPTGDRWVQTQGVQSATRLPLKWQVVGLDMQAAGLQFSDHVQQWYLVETP